MIVVFTGQWSPQRSEGHPDHRRQDCEPLLTPGPPLYDQRGREVRPENLCSFVFFTVHLVDEMFNAS